MIPPADALRQTAFEILEEGMFLFIEEAAPEVASESLCFTMAIEEAGAICGEVGLQATGDAAQMLASNMLGIEIEEVTDAERSAAVSEALNIVAGRLMHHILGAERVFELHPPVSGGAPRGDIITFQSGEGQLMLWYTP